MNNAFKTIAIWLVIGLVLMTLFSQFTAKRNTSSTVDFSAFMQEVKGKQIAEVQVDSLADRSYIIRGKKQDGSRFVTFAPNYIWLMDDLLKSGIKIEVKPPEEQSYLANIFINWFPMLLLIGVWIFFMRQMQGGGRGGAFSFGKSRARMLDESTNVITFADVAGCDEAKEEVAELVEFLRDPGKFQDRKSVV